MTNKNSIEAAKLPEAGGTATQAGIYYQNSVAALALADLLELDQRIARERAIEVRLEAPESVDDVVIRFADGHQEFLNVKLSVQVGNNAWGGIWKSLSAQSASTGFTRADQLTLVIAERNDDSEALAALCERASASIDEPELRGRLSRPQAAAFSSVAGILGGVAAAFDILRRTHVHYLPLAEIERDLARRRLAGTAGPPPPLLPILRGGGRRSAAKGPIPAGTAEAAPEAGI